MLNVRKHDVSYVLYNIISGGSLVVNGMRSMRIQL